MNESKYKFDKKFKAMQNKVEVFNIKHPVGSFVTTINDIGDLMLTKVKAPAQILGGHSAVVWLAGISGCYDLNRVR